MMMGRMMGMGHMMGYYQGNYGSSGYYGGHHGMMMRHSSYGGYGYNTNTQTQSGYRRSSAMYSTSNSRTPVTYGTYRTSSTNPAYRGTMNRTGTTNRGGGHHSTSSTHWSGGVASRYMSQSQSTQNRIVQGRTTSSNTSHFR